MEQLTAKNGQKEWQYEGKTVIAILETETACEKCVFENARYCSDIMININCMIDFREKPDVVFIEKPSDPCEK